MMTSLPAHKVLLKEINTTTKVYIANKNKNCQYTWPKSGNVRSDAGKALENSSSSTKISDTYLVHVCVWKAWTCRIEPSGSKGNLLQNSGNLTISYHIYPLLVFWCTLAPIFGRVWALHCPQSCPKGESAWRMLQRLSKPLPKASKESHRIKSDENTRKYKKHERQIMLKQSSKPCCVGVL